MRLLLFSSSFFALDAVANEDNEARRSSRAELMKLLFAYLKEHDLKDPENDQFFTPDKKMSKVFGKDKIRAFSMSKFIGEHLTPINKILVFLKSVFANIY